MFGEVRESLVSTGTPIGPYDLQIAAIALANDLTLVTHNTREFSRVNGHGLKIGKFKLDRFSMALTPELLGRSVLLSQFSSHLEASEPLSKVPPEVDVKSRDLIDEGEGWTIRWNAQKSNRSRSSMLEDLQRGKIM